MENCRLSRRFGDALDLPRALHQGLLPSIYPGDEPDLDLAAHVCTCLHEWIAHEAVTHSVPAFPSFLEVAPRCHA